MKIPENPYYGSEDNTQWQPNGVIIDSGVGGGVVGSGDAGARPVYPVHHIPRHIPAGYVMGPYYPQYAAPAPVPDDFEDYMWMENEEEFDKQVMQQLEEEALMEQCIEAMLEDEQRERHRTVSNGHCATTSTGSSNLSLEETVSRSTLNPLAAEFVPSRIIQPPEEKQESPPEVRTDIKVEVESAKESNDVTDNAAISTEEPPPPPPPTQHDQSQPEVTEVETKKTKPEVKAKTKQNTKTDIKAVKNVVKSESVEEKTVDVKATGDETEFKPINYAAAAKANKPKKPETDKTKSEKPVEKPKTDKPVKQVEKKPSKEKSKIKPEKPVQRKNSTK